MTLPLTNRFKGVLQKRLGVALGVWGEAGSGKSHGVNELLRRLAYHSLSLHATSSLSVVAQKLPKPKKLAHWAENNLDRLSKGETLETSSTLDSLGATFSGLAPFVLHLEDVHETDEERFSFIQELAKVVSRSKGVGLVVTSCKEPLDPFTTFKLEPLSRQESDRLLEVELRASLPKEASEFIYSKATGNPLYTLEYLRYLTRQGFLWNDGCIWYWRKPEGSVMPATVEALIEQLINRAKAEPLQTYVLETKAFLPLNSSDEVWQKIARVNTQELLTAKTELSQQGIFKEHDFAHPLFREVTLNNLSPERKQHLARRAINVLQDEPEYIVRFVDDAKLEPEKALELLERTAAMFETEGKKLEASRCLEKAVRYASGEEKGQLTLRAARLASKNGDTKFLELARQATELLGETEETLRVLVVAHALRGERRETQALLSRFKGEVDKDWLIQQLNTVGAFDDVIKLSTTLDLEKVNEGSIYCIAYALMVKGDLTGDLELAERRLQRQGLSRGQKLSYSTFARGCCFTKATTKKLMSFFQNLLRFMDKIIKKVVKIGVALLTRFATALSTVCNGVSTAKCCQISSSL